MIEKAPDFPLKPSGIFCSDFST